MVDVPSLLGWGDAIFRIHSIMVTQHEERRVETGAGACITVEGSITVVRQCRIQVTKIKRLITKVLSMNTWIHLASQSLTPSCECIISAGQEKNKMSKYLILRYCFTLCCYGFAASFQLAQNVFNYSAL